jgi:hypothetical protein
MNEFTQKTHVAYEMSGYQVVEANSRAELKRQVDRYLAKDWKLQGGVAVSTDVHTDKYGNVVTITWLYQAVYKG